MEKEVTNAIQESMNPGITKEMTTDDAVKYFESLIDLAIQRGLYPSLESVNYANYALRVVKYVVGLKK